MWVQKVGLKFRGIKALRKFSFVFNHFYKNGVSVTELFLVVDRDFAEKFVGTPCDPGHRAPSEVSLDHGT